MKMRKPEEVDFSDSSDEFEVDDDADSDEALQEAFAAGKLKPGLVVVNSSGKEPEKKPVAINDVAMLSHHLDKIKLPKKFGWVERLDIVNDVAPLAPEIAVQMDEHKGKRSREIKLINNQRKSKGNPTPSLKSLDDDPIHNDFTREMGFYRQAQEAVLKCLPRLRELGVPTKRPDDYFAEMAKSDSHMQKVAKVLLKKQTATEKAEKVRKLREQKKFAKQTQVQVMQDRQKAKKEMIESVKKYRKGQQGGNLDFLEERKKGGRDAGRNKGGGKGEDKRVNYRRQNKNEKYGYGGKKKGQKWNTKDSLDNFEDSKKKGGSKGYGRGKPVGKGGRGNAVGGRHSAGSGGGGGGKRPGKNNRQKIKARKN